MRSRRDWCPTSLDVTPRPPVEACHRHAQEADCCDELLFSANNHEGEPLGMVDLQGDLVLVQATRAAVLMWSGEVVADVLETGEIFDEKIDQSS